MEIMSIALLSSCSLIGPPDTANWTFDITSSGENQSWVAPTPIRADGVHYELLYTVTGATVMVSYIGIDFGPIDVLDMIPPYALETRRIQNGPCPLDFGWTTVSAPEGQIPPSLSFDWMVELNAKGRATFLMENLFLGQADYDLGWPWGSVTVQIESGTVTANVKLDIVQNPCYADIDNNGVVDVVDLLELIGAWGECGDCPIDPNADGYVDVTDLLMIVGSWGTCPS